MKLSLIIVNYNTESYICDLLQDLMAQTLPTDQWQVVIVNNSQNDKLEIMTQRFQASLSCTIIQSPQNVGFGRAMNLAAKHAQGEMILLMNPDMRMMQVDYLTRLLKYAQDHEGFGVISTQVFDDDNNDVSTYHQYEFGETLGYDNQICWFQGSLMLIKANVFAKIQGFDPDFFMYCEDVDLCYRIKKLGMPLLKCEDLKIYHYGGASELKADYSFYFKYYKSRFLFAYKHYPKQMYDKIVHRLNEKASQRIKVYRITSYLIDSHKVKLTRNLVTMEMTNKILTQSSDWLFDWDVA